MKLRTFARSAGVRYETAWRWFKMGQIKGYQLPTGTIIITEGEAQPHENEPYRVAVYARVSANEHRPNLERQAERLTAYCSVRGYQVAKVVKEVGSGVNDHRKKLLTILADPSLTLIVVEHRDRLTRFGFKYLEILLSMQGLTIEVLNPTETAIEDILADLTSIIYSFCARLYGQRRAKRRTEALIQQLTPEGGEADASRGADDHQQE